MITRRQLLFQASVVPYLDKRGAPARPGPAAGGELPSSLADIPIGFFGPAEAKHASGGAVFMGVQLAIEDANAGRGRGDKPFRLATRWSDDPWRSGASAVVRLVYSDNVLAVIGGIDGATTHLAAQVAAKALVPVVDPVSTDDSSNQAGVPWVFSWAPSDTVLAGEIAQMIAGNRWALLASTDHDSRHLAGALLRIASPPVRRIDFAMPAPELTGSVLQDDPALTVLLAPPAATAALASVLSAKTRLLCGPGAWSRLCGAVRPAAPRLCETDAALLWRLQQRFGCEADCFSQLAYESTSFLLHAARAAGLSRRALREALAPRFASNGRRAVSNQLQETSYNNDYSGRAE